MLSCIATFLLSATRIVLAHTCVDWNSSNLVTRVINHKSTWWYEQIWVKGHVAGVWEFSFFCLDFQLFFYTIECSVHKYRSFQISAFLQEFSAFFSLFNMWSLTPLSNGKLNMLSCTKDLMKVQNHHIESLVSNNTISKSFRSKVLQFKHWNVLDKNYAF